ncbi:MAG: hypothetical protein HUJ27_14135 [Rhodobacteraceae bacterium]|nr:hypothetical protein [Paracoccaceae bacterium]
MAGIRTKVFGNIPVQKGVAILPKGPGLVGPTEIDLDDLPDYAAHLGQLGAFLDRLPSHLETARNRFIEDYKEIGGVIPEWLEDEAPKIYAELFPETPDPRQVTPEQLWSTLNIHRIWVSAGPLVTLDLGIGESGSDHMNYLIDYFLAAYFHLDGKLIELSLES